MAVKTDTLQIKFTTDGSGKVRAELQGVSQDIAKVEQASGGAASKLASFKGAITGLVGSAVVQYIASTTMEFQRLQAALTTVTGSSAAAEREFAKLKQFAATTPYQLQEVVDAFIKLKARGLDPSIETLRSFGNTAAATGKSLDQFIEAVADAATGQMERLKEFGIVARQEGDQVAFTFQGVTTEVQRNADAITDYLQRIGDVNFAGGMERQAATLGGAFSNAQDAAADLASTIGNILSPTLIALAKDTSTTTGELALFLRGLERLGNVGAGGAVGTLTDLADRFNSLSLLNAPGEALYDYVVEGQRAYEGQGQAIDGLIDKVKAWGAAQEKAHLAQTTVSDSTQKLVDDLEREAAAYGLSKSALLEMEKAQRLKAAANDVERAALTQAYDALIAKAKAEEQATAADKRNAQAARDTAKEQRDAAKAAEAREKEMAALTAQILAANEAEREYQNAVQSLVEELDPAQRALREFREAYLLVQEAVGAGDLSTEQAANMVAALQQRYSAALTSINDATNEEIRRGAEEALTDIQRIWLNGMDEVGDGIADSLMSGFKDGGEGIKDALRNLLRDMMRLIIQQKLVIPMQAQFLQGQGFSQQQIQQMIPGFMPQNGGVGGPSGGTQGPGPWSGGYNYGSGGGSGSGGNSGSGGGNSSVFGGSAWGAGLAIAGSIGQGYVGSSSTGASVLGGAASGAALGTQILPGIGTIVGAIIGAVIGFVSAQDPYLEVSGSASGINRGRVEGHARSQLGDIYVGKDDLTLEGNMSSQELADRIAAVDNALADILDSADLSAAREALTRFDVNQSGGNINPEKIIEQRLRLVINAVEPEFARFLNGISDIEERVRTFGALRQLKEYIADFDDGIAEISTNGVTKLRTQMRNLDEAVETTGAQLAEAIASKDVEAIAQAAEAAKQAVIRRYQAEIELAEQLAANIEQADRAMRSFALNMAQRIAGVGGSQGAVLDVTAANVAATRNNVLNSTDTQRALQHLDEFVSAVDAWLQQSRAAVQAWYNEQSQALQVRMVALDEEQAAIMGAAQWRAEWEAQQAAAWGQQQQAAADAARAALEEQLRIANEWLGVLDSADQLIRELVQSSANPMSGFGRLALLDADIARAQQDFAAGQSPEAAQELMQLLQQRLQLAGELYDRPSGEYLAIYNNTLRELSALREAARGPAEQAALLQAELNALTQAGNDNFSSYASADLQFTADEQARLAEIDAERERIAEAQRLLDEEAAARLKAIDDEARAYYEWAQTEGLRLQEEWRAEQVALLEELTGGVPLQEFIAQRQAEATELLGNIRDDLRTFLDLLAGNVVGGGAGGGGGGGNGPRDPGDIIPRGGSVGAGSITVPLAIDFNVDGAKFGRYVAEVVIDKAGVVAPTLKRAMKVA